MAKRKIPWSEAVEIAGELTNQLSQFCDKIRPAGSLRRRSEFVGDLEIVIIPKLLNNPGFAQASMLNAIPDVHIETPKVNVTFKALKEAEALHNGQWFRLCPYDKKDGEKYKKYQVRGMDEEWIQVDLFFATPENFGLIYFMRTGPALFSKKMMTRPMHGGALPQGHFVQGGYLWKEAHDDPAIPRIMVPIREERELFDLCGYRLIDPSKRNDWERHLTKSDEGVIDVHEGDSWGQVTLHGLDDNEGWTQV